VREAGTSDATLGDAASEAGKPDSGASDAGANASEACTRAAAPADRVRKIVVSHPFDAGGMPATDYEVLDLEVNGTIATTGTHFQLHATSGGRITFTPDGAVGLVAQDDGTLGVFAFDASGNVHVVSAGLSPTYVSAVVMAPGGAHAYLLNDDWRNSGGGVYSAAIGCDGTVSSEGLVVPSRLPAGLVLLDGGTAFVAATDFGSFVTDAGEDAGPLALLVDWPAPATVLARTNPFGDTLAILSDVALTPDGRYALLADDNAFSGIANRVAVVELASGGVNPAQVITPVTDPQSIVASPFDDTVIVTSGMGNAIYVLTYAAGPAPFSLAAPLAYVGAPPQLPASAEVVRVGGLEGLVLVAENLGVRRLRFAAGGSVSDLGLTSLGTALTSIVGAIGVQP